MEFKDKLRKLRTDAGLSQEALADIIHISRSAIAKYENGNGNPSEETLKALAFYFGVEVSELKSDEVIKKENKKNKINKWGKLISLVVLSICIVVSTTIGIISLLDNDDKPTNSNSGIAGDSYAKLTGVYENIGLLRMDDFIPRTKDEFGNTVYIVNTYMSFTITILPKFTGGSRPIMFIGDIAEFDTAHSKFASIHYSDSYESETKYIINFKKEGSFEVKYTISGYTRVVRFKCDNIYYEWDNYKADLSSFYPWMKNIPKEDIVSIRYETGSSSLGPNHFRDIYYTNDENDISDAYNFLSTKVWYTNFDNTLDGTYENIITYNFANAVSQSFNESNNFISITSSKYILESSIPKPQKYYEHRYAFNIYGNNIRAIVINFPNLEYDINYLYNIEFIEWPSDEIYEEIEPTFTISGYPENNIKIYTPNRFSYQGKMYKIVSNQDFTDIFNWYALFNPSNN